MDTVLQLQIHQCCVKEKDYLSQSVSNIWPTAAKIAVSLLAEREHVTHIQLVSTGTSRSFSAGLLCFYIAPNIY